MSDMDWQPADEQYRTDRNIAGRWNEYEEFVVGTAVTHTRRTDETGPDYCFECTEAWQEWVKWPCRGAYDGS